MSERELCALIVKAAGRHIRRLAAHQQTRDSWFFYVNTVIADAKKRHAYRLWRAALRVKAEAEVAQSIAAYERSFCGTMNSQQPEAPVSIPPNSNTGVNPEQLVFDIMGVRDVPRET